MADTRTIRIEFITGKPELTEEEKKQKEEEKQQQKKDNEAKKAAKKKKDFLINSAKQAQNLLDNALRQGIERYYSLNEDYIAQNSINIFSNVANQTKNLVMSVSTAAAAAGPVGAGITLALWAGNKILETRSGYSQIRQGINENNYNMNFQRIRMGLVDNGRGTEN